MAAALVSLSLSPVRAAEPDGPPALIGQVDAVAIVVQSRLGGKSNRVGDVAQKGLADYYADPDRKLLWVDTSGLTPRAKSVMEVIQGADDYGLRASDYELPSPPAVDPADHHKTNIALADAEITLSLAVVRYARDARGGRLDPQRISANLDPTLALPDPMQLMESMAIRADAATYLLSFQPAQPQFESLRKALAAARGGKPEVDVVTIPDGVTLKLGVEDDQVPLLRTRLKVAAADAPGNERVFDPALDEAVRRFQKSNGVAADGVVGPGTRRLLNQPHGAGGNPARVRLILLNMERWRWLPNDLGSFYVAVNIPEFMLNVVEDGKVIQAARVVVGKTDKQTPIFTQDLREIVFNPYWNVPTSIKTDEILPTLMAGGGGFFGGGYDTGVFARNGLRINFGGKEVDPAAVDWSRTDIRTVNVYQPPGPSNVLGTVKFLFPNKHDVYMHDTTQKEFFAQTVRAESHGCMRVQNPDQLAIIILKKDQGWGAGNVASAIRGAPDQHIALKERIPVYVNYFTLKANEDGSIATFGDLYGHDSRMAAALFGDRVPVEAAVMSDVEAIPVSQPTQRRREARGGFRGNSIADSLARFLDN